MKKILTGVVLVSALLSLSACNFQGNNMKNAIAYHNQIVELRNEVYHKASNVIDYISDMDWNNYEKMKEKIYETSKEIQEYNEKINELGTYKENDTIQKAAIAYVESVDSLLTKDWIKRVETIKNMMEIKSYSEKEKEAFGKKFDLLREERREKIDKIRDERMQANEKFASEYGYRIPYVLNE